MCEQSTDETRTIGVEQNTRRSGNSTVVTIPPLLLQAVGLHTSDTVKLAASDGEIMLARKEESG
jgi:antitoxin component of MazEF toxin-antitoxin module